MQFSFSKISFRPSKFSIEFRLRLRYFGFRFCNWSTLRFKGVFTRNVFGFEFVALGIYLLNKFCNAQILFRTWILTCSQSTTEIQTSVSIKQCTQQNTFFVVFFFLAHYFPFHGCSANKRWWFVLIEQENENSLFFSRLPRTNEIKWFCFMFGVREWGDSQWKLIDDYYFSITILFALHVNNNKYMLDLINTHRTD